LREVQVVLIWRSTDNKDLLRMGITWEEAELMTDQDGVGVRPNASTWKGILAIKKL